MMTYTTIRSQTTQCAKNVLNYCITILTQKVLLIVKQIRRKPQAVKKQLYFMTNQTFFNGLRPNTLFLIFLLN